MAMVRKIKKAQSDEAITFREAFELFVQEKEALGCSPATIRAYRAQVCDTAGKYLFPEEDSRLEELTQGDIFRYINHLKNREISAHSIQTYVRSLRAFIYWCMEEPRKYIQPAFRIKLPKAQEEQIKFFSDDDLEKLLQKPKRNASFVEWRTWTTVNWILATGNRLSTVIDVKIGDIDFKRKEIMLHHTKNKKAQIIPLSATLELVLKEYIRMWRKDAPDDAYLFPNVGDTQLGKRGMGSAFELYCKDRGCAKTSIHSLRHSFARMWVKSNGNLFQLQKILGHSTLAQTQRYSRLFGEDLKDDFNLHSPLDNLSRNKKRTQQIKNRP